MILSRTEFAEMFNSIRSGLGDKGSALWEAECDIPDCQWFVQVRPLEISGKRHGYKNSYWAWCNQNLTGKTRCFSSNNDDAEEWWGFTNKDDIVLWTLRWS